jgi:hypothetical protein
MQFTVGVGCWFYDCSSDLQVIEKRPPTWVYRKCGWTENNGQFQQISAVVRAGQAIFNVKSYLQQNNFNQQRFPADGILIPHLQ